MIIMSRERRKAGRVAGEGDDARPVAYPEEMETLVAYLYLECTDWCGTTVCPSPHASFSWHVRRTTLALKLNKYREPLLHQP